MDTASFTIGFDRRIRRRSENPSRVVDYMDRDAESVGDRAQPTWDLAGEVTAVEHQVAVEMQGGGERGQEESVGVVRRYLAHGIELGRQFDISDDNGGGRETNEGGSASGLVEVPVVDTPLEPWVLKPVFEPPPKRLGRVDQALAPQLVDAGREDTLDAGAQQVIIDHDVQAGGQTSSATAGPTSSA